MTVALTVDTSAISDGLTIDAADVTLPISQLKTAQEDVLNGIQSFDRLSFGAAESLVINVSGQISPTKTHIIVDTFASASTDDLDTINNGIAGRIIFIRPLNSARTVVLRHGTGNIRTASGDNINLNSTDRFAILIHSGFNWLAAMMPTSTNLNVGTILSLVISGGAITRSRTRHTLDTEGGASFDELTQINGGSVGDVLVLSLQANTRIVRVRHAVSNIFLADRQDRILSNAAAFLFLIFDGGVWMEMSTPPSIPYPTARRFVTAQASGATPFIEVMGAPAATVTGTGSVSNQSDSVYANFIQAAATINTFAGFASTVFNIARRQYNPKFVCILRTGANAADIQNIRFWIGLSSATVAVTTDTLATSFIGFRFSTASDTGWVGIVSDGSSQSTTSALTDPVTSDTVYKLEFRVDDATGLVYFKVNDSPETFLNTNLPLSTTDLGYHARQSTLAAATKNFRVSRLYVETD